MRSQILRSKAFLGREVLERSLLVGSFITVPTTGSEALSVFTVDSSSTPAVNEGSEAGREIGALVDDPADG